MPKKSRSGFVYASRTPQSPWIKLGFTRRIPNHRLKELSTSNSHDNFSLIDARFVGNALSAEKYIHRCAERLNWDRKKEFFKASDQEVKDLFDQMGCPRTLAQTYMSPPTLLSSDYEYLSDVVLEKMAIAGDSLASFRVAQRLLEEKDFTTAMLMFKASSSQGHDTAFVHEQFLKSHLSPSSSLTPLWEAFYPFYQQMEKGGFVPQDVEALLHEEQKSWKTLPHRGEDWALYLKNIPVQVKSFKA